MSQNNGVVTSTRWNPQFPTEPTELTIAPAGNQSRAMVRAQDAGFQLVSNAIRVANQDSFVRQQIVNNFSLIRQELLRKLTDPRRDFNAECGYPVSLRTQDYKQMYERNEIAGRVVSIYPEECWGVDPEIYEDEDTLKDTPFEQDIKEIWEELNLNAAMQIADEVSRIARYGCILLGFDDVTKEDDLAKPVRQGDGSEKPDKERKLLFTRCFDESMAQITQYDNKNNSPRFGQPEFYNLTLLDVQDDNVYGNAAMPPNYTKRVHWSRVIHIAEGKTSPVFHIPPMRPVFNRLCDVAKTMAAAGEGFWRGAIQTFSIEALPQAIEAGVDINLDEIRSQMASFGNSAQRYLAWLGMTTKSLAPTVVSPKDHFMAHIQAIAVNVGSPMRKFVGSEVGELASSMDDSHWNKKLTRRQIRYLTPYVVRRLVDRLIWAGCVRPPKKDKKYTVEWPDLSTPSDKDKSAVALQNMQALSTYVTGQVEQIMPLGLALEKVMKFSKEEATTIVEEAEKHQIEMLDQQEQVFERQQELLGEHGADIQGQQQQEEQRYQDELGLKKEAIKQKAVAAKKKPTANVWSDASRKAALEARKRKGKHPPIEEAAQNPRGALEQITEVKAKKEVLKKKLSQQPLAQAHQKLDALKRVPTEEKNYDRGDEVSTRDIFAKDGQMRLFGIPHPNWFTEEEVDLSKVIPSQHTIPVEGIRAYMEDMPEEGPSVASYDGRFYAHNHTRLAAKLLLGETKAVVKVYHYQDKNGEAKQFKPPAVKK